LRQTDLAFITAPKLRAKGRFQSISKLLAWGDKILTVLAVKGAAKKGSLLLRVREALLGFSRLKPFIRSFSSAAQATSEIMELVKNQGLEQKSYQLCQEITAQLPRRSVVRKRLKQWLNEHLAIQKEITSLPLLVSSDIIESLFGHFKHVIERSAQVDMNRIALLIPVLCGEIDETVFENALNHVKHKDLKDWEEVNIPYTVRKKRQEFLNKHKGKSEIQKAVKTSYV
jgi:tRNA(Ile)-lysidine synthase TilS/MesJ